MIEAAELIRHTYDGWDEDDIQAFEDMLVYPGYSTTQEPSGDISFYWMAYQGDHVRHGNQGLSGWRTVMAMGIFLDNEIMYDRALRYVKGQDHRSDDLPYPSGPHTIGNLSASTDYADTYAISIGNGEQDYGFNGVMTNYIWENGQCQESSRDQQHTTFGLGLLTSMAEMAWSQGEDLYAHEENRLLLGLEFNLKYNVSAVASYSDQPSPWEPTVDSGEFEERFDRTGRWYSKAISPDGVGGIFNGARPVFEMPVAHYVGRGLKSEDEVKWTIRARDLAIDESGYEVAGWTNDALGWGALTARRPDGCYGDPITGFDSNNLPEYAMHVLPTTIEAENFDNFSAEGNGITYYDSSLGNSGNEYRTDDVDIQESDEGGYNVGWMTDGEWLTYSIYVPEDGNYDLTLHYAASIDGSSVSFEFDGDDKTGEVSTPSTGGHQIWKDLSIGESISLKQGVQSLKLLVSGTDNVLNINNFTLNESESANRLVQLIKGNATGYAIDGNSSGSNGQDVYLWQSNPNNINQQWIEIDRGDGYYSYQKNGTDYCLDGKSGGENAQNIYLWSCNDSNYNQQWLKVELDDGSYRLEKRNASDFSFDGNNNGGNGQSIYLWRSNNNNGNQQWIFNYLD
jgi:hypothetical protein